MGLKDKAQQGISFLKGAFNIDQAADNLGINYVTTYGLRSERIGGLSEAIGSGDFAEKSNTFVTSKATPWLNTRQDGEMHDKTVAFHDNYESYMRTRLIRQHVEEEIQTLRYEIVQPQEEAPGEQDPALLPPASPGSGLSDLTGSAKVTLADQEQATQAIQGGQATQDQKGQLRLRTNLSAEEQDRLEFLQLQLRRIKRTERIKTAAMATDSHHMLGFSFEPVDDRVIVVKTPVIMSKAPTYFQTNAGSKPIGSDWQKQEEQS